MLLAILIVLLLCFGGFGISPYNTYGCYGWSPVCLIFIVLIVPFFLGRFR